MLLLVAPAAACGDDAAIGPDAGGPPTTRLVIQDPPGDEIGVPPATRVTLRVRHESELGEPIAGTQVGFVLQPGTGGSTGGATLSAAAAETDALGIAQLDLALGAERSMFRVTASAANAPSVSFYVNVSPGGFANLVITPVHEGPRASGLYDQVEVRMYRADELHCGALDIDAPPASQFPPRSLPGFGGSVTYSSINAGEPHTLVAWAIPAGGTLATAVGCIDLGGSQLLATDVLLDVPVTDRPMSLPAALPLASSIDLNALATAIEVTGIDRPWRRLACPAGPGQLLLDCALDAYASDGVLDCVVEGEAALLDATAALRGEPGADGCRPAQAGAEPSLDARLEAAIAAGGTFPTGAALADLLEARSEALTAVELGSELIASGGSRNHRLVSAAIDIAGTSWEAPLLASDRPIVSAPVVPDLGGGAVVALAEHGFTLDYGLIARDALTEVALVPAGLDPQALGTALAESTTQGNLDGCAAMSALVCTEAGFPTSCLQASCAAAAVALDQRFPAWWQALDGAGLDLVLAGSVGVDDTDFDLVVDTVTAGSWTATFTMADDSAVQAPGTVGPGPLP